jgi:glycosyltransferase involved in cell wall biosynthesis
MPINILHVIDKLDEGGGQLPIPLNITENIDNNKFKCFVCALRLDNPVKAQNTEIITLNYKKWDPRIVLRLPEICRKYKIDIIHAHFEKSIIGSLLATYLYPAPVIMHEHGGIFQKGFSIYKTFIKLFGHKAEIIIGCSNATLNELKKTINIDPEKARVLYTAIDIKSFVFSENLRKQTRKELEISDNTIVIGFVGRLHKMKGVDLLLRAMPSLLENSKEYILLIAGDGPERGSLESQAEKLGIYDKTKFLGTYKNVPKIMSACDIGVMPSLYEPFGRVAVEFMRMKVPLVTSGAAGLAELVKDGQTGLIPRENTPEEICACIRKLLMDSNLKAKIIEKAYHFSESFGISQYIKNLEKIYTEVNNHSNRKT